MKIQIVDNGDWSVGLAGAQWEIEIPFTEQEVNTDECNDFINELRKLYADYCNGSLYVFIDTQTKRTEP